jgi:hypothetical protein
MKKLDVVFRLENLRASETLWQVLGIEPID